LNNNEKEIMLSFIIPVYNVEKYIRECVESILQQITDECEIILVNDGSTDSSGDICSQYAENDMRIHVINKENGGLSSARNAGLTIAKGKYITFVDSDDKVFANSISKILTWIKSGGTDLCFLKVAKLYPDGTMQDMDEGIYASQFQFGNRKEAIKYLASRSKFPGSSCAKLFRRDFLLTNNLHFPYDRRYSEDLGFMGDCILYARSFDALDIPYYQYRQNRQGSITNKITSKNFYDLFKFITESAEKLTIHTKAKNFTSKSVMAFVAYEYSVLLYLYQFIAKKDKGRALKRLEEYKWVLNFAGCKKIKIISYLCKIFGIRSTSLILLYDKRREK